MYTALILIQSSPFLCVCVCVRERERDLFQFWIKMGKNNTLCVKTCGVEGSRSVVTKDSEVHDDRKVCIHIAGICVYNWDRLYFLWGMSWDWRNGSWLKLNSWHILCFCGVQEFTLCKQYCLMRSINCLSVVTHVVCSQSSNACFLCMLPIMFSVLCIKGVCKVITASNYQAMKSYRRSGSEIPSIYLSYM